MVSITEIPAVLKVSDQQYRVISGYMRVKTGKALGFDTTTADVFKIENGEVKKIADEQKILFEQIGGLSIEDDGSN